MLDRLNEALSGRYRIERELGAGGMATVYLADDLKHSRKVAIKVLHPELSAVIGAERFLGEIRTTANLQHPHILPLFDSGEADALLFYVMPYVDGESLRDRLDREKQLPVKEAVGIVDDVGSALDYAHRQGIVHRDIKPANILLHDGQPLVADFGIALALSTAGSSGRLTETGLSLGTPVYMAPEQASGEGVIDPRSDIYALGCVLYEMLVGDPPFQASTPQAILAKVLTSTPDRAVESRTSVPAHVDAVVARSMERIPADRFESVAEMRRALDDPGFRHGDAAGGAGPVGARIGVGAAAVLAALVVVLGIVAAVGWSRGGGGAAPYRVVTMDPSPTGLNGARGIALSPDGRLLAFVDSASNLRVVTLDGSEPPIVPEIGRAVAPRFSPDGSRLGFGITGVSVSGYPVLAWIPADGADRPRRMGEMREWDWWWGDDGEIRIEANDGVLEWGDDGEPGDRLPQPDGHWGHVRDRLPDGRMLVTLDNVPDERRIGVWDPVSGRIDTPTEQSDLAGLVEARFRNGVLFWRDSDGVLSATPFDLDDGVVGPRIELQDSVVITRFGHGVAVSRDGTLVTANGRVEGGGETLAWTDPAGNVEIIDEGWSEEFDQIREAVLSPDGRRVAMLARPRSTALTGRWGWWLLDLETGSANPLTLEGTAVVWVDDARVAYHAPSSDGRRASIVTRAIDGSGTEELVLELPEGEGAFHAIEPLPDGSGMLFTLHREDDQDDIFFLSFEDGASPEAWQATQFNESQPTVSPDGDWVAFSSTSGGSTAAYVRPYSGSGPTVRVSPESPDLLAWSPDGSTLYFREVESEALHFAALALDEGRVRVVQSGLLVQSTPEIIGPKGAVEPTTGRFLSIASSAEPPDYRIRVHLNVFGEIERRVAAEGGGE